VVGDTPKNTAGASLGVRGGFLKSDSLNKDARLEASERGSRDGGGKRRSPFGPAARVVRAVVKGSAWSPSSEFKEIGPAAKR